MSLSVLTWNLMHGRAVPPAGHDLFEEFATALEDWEWNVALLQEVPPWWPALLGPRLRADWRLVMTSRNFGLALRRAIAVRWPDAIKSNGGGCNAVLARGTSSIAERRTLMLALAPERRWLLGVRLSSGTWVGTLHLTGGIERAAAREAGIAAAAMVEWSAGAPVVLGGDFNLRSVELPGFEPAGGHEVDHILVRGIDVASPARALDRGVLSDHVPLLAAVTPAGSRAP
jgi:endonuclease/exonuclease/phosphatase family metal-dependent hydrolase